MRWPPQNVQFAEIEDRLAKGQMITAKIHRIHLARASIVVEICEKDVLVIVREPLCPTVKTIEKALSLLFNSKEEAAKFLERYLRTSNPEKNGGWKMSSLGIGSWLRKILWFEPKIPKIKIDVLSPMAPSHDLLLVGVREYGGKKFYIVYDQNFERRGLPMVYELPFEFIFYGGAFGEFFFYKN